MPNALPQQVLMYDYTCVMSESPGTLSASDFRALRAVYNAAHDPNKVTD